MVKNSKELRKELLNSYGFYDEVGLDSSFKDHLKLANIICNSPIAYISLLDGENQYILSQEGAEFETMPSNQSFCQHTLFKNEALIINDTSKDIRTKNLPLATNDPAIKFYVGIPLHDENNDTLGSFCVIDYKVRELSDSQIDGLKILANHALTALQRKKKILPILKAHSSNNNINLNSIHSIEEAFVNINKKLIEQNEQIQLKTKEQEKLNKQLKQQKNDLILITDAMPACISFVDTEYCYQLNNSVYEEWFGFTKEELKGQHVSIVIGEEGFKTNKPMYDRVFEGEIIEYENEFRNKHLKITYLPAFCCSGKKVIGCYVFAEDYSQVKNYRMQLERSNEGFKRFAYAASHDMRSPLRTIKSFTKLLKDELEKENIPYNDEYMKYIIRAVTTLDELTIDLLDYAQIDNRSSKLSDINLNEAIDIVQLNLKSVIDENNAIIEYIPNDIEIYANKTDVYQLLQNLISNGIKYQKEGQKAIIKISAAIDKNRCHIVIKDNGIGIEEKSLDKIFTPFTRLHTKQSYKGTGIGLSSCAKIVEKYNSNILVASEVGVGSSFSFHLPCK